MSPIDLVAPAGSNFIKDFPAIHANNMDQLDAFAGPCLPGQGLQVFNPVLRGTSGDPVLGTGGTNGGVNRAYYYRIFDQVYMWGEWKWGTTGASFGGGAYYITLPFTAYVPLGSSNTLDYSPIVGNGTTYDDSSNAGRLPLTVHLRGTTELQFGLRIGSGSGNRDLRSAGYVTWAASDGVSWNAKFMRVPS